VKLDRDVEVGAVLEQEIYRPRIDVLVEGKLVRGERRVLVGLDRLEDRLAEWHVLLVGIVPPSLGLTHGWTTAPRAIGVGRRHGATGGSRLPATPPEPQRKRLGTEAYSMEFRSALAQINPTTGDVEGNTERILDELDRAAAAGVDVVVFPELAVTGYCILDLVEDDTLVAANRRAVERIRENTGRTAAVVGFVDRDGDRKYNAAAVLQDGELKGVARKVLLPNYRYFDDERYFEPGGAVAPVTVDVRGRPVALGVAVCEDMWDGAYDRRPIPELARAGADVIVSVNASPFETGKRQARHATIQRHVAGTGLPFLYVNTAGVADVGRNVVVFDGDSLAYAADGTLLARGDQFAEDRVTVTIGGRPERARQPHAPPVVPRERELYEALVMALRDYAAKTGFERAVVPVRGDLDSALGLAVCAEALGPGGVVACNVAASPTDDTDAAAALAANLGVEYRALPVRSVWDAAIGVHGTAGGETIPGRPVASLSARLGAAVATLVADTVPGGPALVVATRNETDLALGHATPCGDLTGHLNLIGDLSATDVLAVARYAEERAPDPLFPPTVFERGPASGCEHESVLDRTTVAAVVGVLLEQRCGPAELVAQFDAGELDPARYGVDAAGRTVYERYTPDEFASLVFDTYRKLTGSTGVRVRTPPVVAVSSRAFGLDFREPIINAWDGRMPRWADSASDSGHRRDRGGSRPDRRSRQDHRATFRGMRSGGASVARAPGWAAPQR